MSHSPSRRGHDAGFSLVEILVAVVLLGGAGVSVLGAMAVSIRGSAIVRDGASAEAWLQNSADYLNGPTSPLRPCSPGVATEYQTSIRSSVTPPAGWVATGLTVTSVKSWNGSSFDATCAGTPVLQLITLSVATPDGRMASSLEVVKGA